MARSKSTRPGALATDEANHESTLAKRRAAAAALRRSGPIHRVPSNRLVGPHPSETISRCTGVIDFLAHIEEPFTDERLDAAKGHILGTVVDALEHAQMILEEIGADPAWEHGSRGGEEVQS